CRRRGRRGDLHGFALFRLRVRRLVTGDEQQAAREKDFQHGHVNAPWQTARRNCALATQGLRIRRRFFGFLLRGAPSNSSAIENSPPIVPHVFSRMTPDEAWVTVRPEATQTGRPNGIQNGRMWSDGMRAKSGPSP